MSTPTPTETTWRKEEISVKGEFMRQERTFRNWITADGSSGFKAEPGRYHLYISHACPWVRNFFSLSILFYFFSISFSDDLIFFSFFQAHRTAILRKLKKLENVISVDVVDWYLDRSVGWTLQAKDPAATLDSVQGFKTLKEVYLSCAPEYKGSITVPVLFDKKTKTIVNNESPEIIQMLNKEFNEFSPRKDLDLYPDNWKKVGAKRNSFIFLCWLTGSSDFQEIDEINNFVYVNINNGVYRCGFAASQEAFDIAYKNLFDALDRIEEILSKNRYLVGDQLTLADIRLFTTILRFDHVYATHFKCNKKLIYADYPNIWGFLKEIYQLEGVAETVNMDHIKAHYYGSHKHLNPSGIIPPGPDLNFNEPHGRDIKFPRTGKL
jgi:putative glutathione S-transferase